MKQILTNFVVLSVTFSLVISPIAPVLPIYGVEAAEVGYAPKPSPATTVVDGIGTAPKVSVTQSSAATAASNPTDPNSKYTLPSQGHVDEASGAFLWSLPITVPEGRAGMTPSVNLSYDSRKNNVTSYIAKGWELDIPYIQRVNKLGVDLMYDRADFSSSMQGELVKLTPTTATKPEQTGLYGAKAGYGRYEYRADGSWVMTDTEGITYIYGVTSRDREQAGSGTSNISMWYLSSMTDTSGNKIEYIYEKGDNGRVYPRAITYGDGMYRVTFEYKSALDKAGYLLGTTQDFAAGLRAKADRKLSAIGVIASSDTRLRYDITNAASNSNISRISITGSGLSDAYEFTYTAESNFTYGPLEIGRHNQNLISLPFGYTIPQATIKWDRSVAGSTRWYGKLSSQEFMLENPTYIDLDGDGWKENIQIGTSSNMFVYGFAATNTTVALKSSWGVQLGTSTKLLFADVTSDGKPDLITAQNETGLNGKVYRNTGSSFTLDNSIKLPTDTYATRMFFSDVNGDSNPDIVFLKAAPARMAVYLSSGNDYKLDPKYTTLGGTWVGNDLYSFFKDINGDGLVDFIRDKEIFLNRKTYFDFSEDYSVLGSTLLRPLPPIT